MKLYKAILLSIIILPLLIRIVLYPVLMDTGAGGGQYNPLTDTAVAADERNMAHEEIHRSMRPILLLIYPLLFLTYWGFMERKPWAEWIWLLKIIFVSTVEIITYFKGGEFFYIGVVLYLTSISLGCAWWVFTKAKLSKSLKMQDVPMVVLTGFMFGVV